MREVHLVGIIHRDSKLENIMLYCILNTLGLCTLIDDGSSNLEHSQMTGTLKYMAPEIVQERRDYNEKVDVDSFGVVVYLILTKGVFPDFNIAEIASGKKAQIPDFISDLSRNLINKCWSLKSKDRPSFAEICEILKGNANKIF